MGESDCEALRDGLLAQPVNAVSSLAFLVAAVYVLHHGRQVPPGLRAPFVAGAAALGLVAVGSVAFHGPQPAWAKLIHDASIAALAIVLLARRRSEVPGGVPPAVAVGGAATLAVAVVVLAAAPSAAVLVHAVLVAAAATDQLHRVRVQATTRSIAGIGVLALSAGAILLMLGRTGGSLCNPASLAQAHAGWHVLGATGTAALFAADAALHRSGTVAVVRAERGRRPHR